MPVEIVTYRKLPRPRPAPKRASASAAARTSDSTEHGTGNASGRNRSRQSIVYALVVRPVGSTSSQTPIPIRSGASSAAHRTSPASTPSAERSLASVSQLRRSVT